VTIRKNSFSVKDAIAPAHVLVSVFDKTGLDTLVNGLCEVDPRVRFYSTGGTGKRIQEILGEASAANYVAVETYTGAPEMEGGLVKTLHPKIHAGLLAERGNPAHETYLFETLAGTGAGAGVYFDILVGNLYPFETATAAEGSGPEDARIHIDIGGPTMVMAGAKNWHSVAVLTSPDQYGSFLGGLQADGGTISAARRFALAQVALRRIGAYRTAIAEYFGSLDYEKDVAPDLSFG